MATTTIKSLQSYGLILLLSGLISACSNPQYSRHDPVQPEQETANTTPSKADPNLIQITAVGDIMLGGSAKAVLKTAGYDYPFAKTRHLLQQSDITIGNLEGPLTYNKTRHTAKKYLFKSPPEKVAPALKKAGFTIMTLANNHTLDYGPIGMQDTINALDQQKILNIGAGNNLEQARQGVIIERKQKKIGFLGYSLTFPKEFWAGKNSPGTAFGHEYQIREDVRRMKKACDLVVVSFHWGREKTTELREYQPRLAHAAIDEGASLIIGHHPHIIQAVESYKQGLILYSLGNYTFGSYSRAAQSSMIATASFDGNQFVSLKLTPINVFNVDVKFQPKLLHGQAADQAIQQINQLSAQRNTYLANSKGTAILDRKPDTIKTASNTH